MRRGWGGCSLVDQDCEVRFFIEFVRSWERERNTDESVVRRTVQVAVDVIGVFRLFGLSLLVFKE